MVMEAHPSHPLEGHPPHHLEGHQAHHLEAHDVHQIETRTPADSQQVEPTPQCVGLEFVRQYYTILNKAPWHLHRFYATNSSFMHSGENSNRQAVIGQGNIHKCIMALDFDDCHAKILLIDSQSTLSNGIVIQVTGELSNRGSPMRRFMQTFVLAPQSEKKYYVHNDIFRYQDQVFHDETSSQVDEISDEQEPEDNQVEEQQIPQVATPQEIVRATKQPPSTTNVAPPPGVPAPAAGPATTQTGGAEYPVSSPPNLQPQVLTPTAPQHINGGVAAPAAHPQPTSAPVVPHNIPHTVASQTTAPTTSSRPQPSPASQVHIPPRQVEPSGNTSSSGNTSNREDNWTGDWVDTNDLNNSSQQKPQKQQTPQQQPTKQEKKVNQNQQQHTTAAATSGQVGAVPQQRSYAAFFKDTSANSMTVNNTTPAQPAPPQQPPQAQQPRETSRPSQQSQAARESQRDRDQGFQKPGRGSRGPARQRNSLTTGELEGNGTTEEEVPFIRMEDRRRGAPSIPDTHQIFVGNLPQQVKEEDLRKTFEAFGPITEVRINIGKGKPVPANGSGKIPQNHVVPNFGFVTFADEHSVSRCLRNRPITINGDHRLNVEEKKTKSKMDQSYPSSRPNMRPMGGRGGYNRMDNNNRGGSGGGRGSYGGPSRR